MRGATRVEARFFTDKAISIHAPHAGCDLRPVPPRRGRRDFNPRTPCGVRRLTLSTTLGELLFQSTHPMRGATRHEMHLSRKEAAFQSTHPMRGATNGNPIYDGVEVFQSTHPMRGATDLHKFRRRPLLHFNPRTPCGVRLVEAPQAVGFDIISIHAPHAGCDTSST